MTRYWLLDLEFAGQTIRLSTADLDIASDAGDLHYVGALQDVQFSEALELLDAQLPEASVSIEAVLPVDVPALISQGYRLEGGVGSLAVWRAGQTWEERRVRLVGTVSNPEYGAADEPVSFSLVDELWQIDTEIPDPTAAVSSATWPDGHSAEPTLDFASSLTPEDLNLAYPVVFGTPGVTSGLSYPAYEGSIAVHVSRDAGPSLAAGWTGPYIVIAGHRVLSDTVYLYTESISNDTWDYHKPFAGLDPQDNGFVVYHKLDALGREVAVVPGVFASGASTDLVNGVEVSSLGANFLNIDLADQSYRSSSDGNGGTIYVPLYVGWYDRTRSDLGGGMVGEDGQLVRGAGDVLSYMLNQTTMKVDRGRTAAAAAALNHLKIDCAIDTRVKVWEWLQSELLPILPVSLANGPDGIYPVVWRYDATAAEAVADLDVDADPTIQRASRVRVDSSKIKNRLRLNFCMNRRTGTAMQYRILDGDYNADDPSTRGSYICAVSQARYRTSRDTGVREDELDTAIVWDVATADAILAIRARAYALAHRTVDYIISANDYETLERGDIVMLTDSEIGVSGLVCLVREIQYDTSDTIAVSLLIIEDPARDSL